MLNSSSWNDPWPLCKIGRPNSRRALDLGTSPKFKMFILNGRFPCYWPWNSTVKMSDAVRLCKYKCVFQLPQTRVPPLRKTTLKQEHCCFAFRVHTNPVYIWNWISPIVCHRQFPECWPCTNNCACWPGISLAVSPWHFIALLLSLTLPYTPFFS